MNTEMSFKRSFKRSTRRDHFDIDREIDKVVHRNLMHQPPPPGIYATILGRVRNETTKPPADPSRSLSCASGLVAAAVLIAVAILLAASRAPRAATHVPFLHWLTSIHNTGLSTWINESESFLAYPTILFLHTLGLAVLVGFSVSADIRLLGVAPRVPLASVSRLFPLMWLGFWINAISGTLLFIADPIRKSMNPLFEVKLGLVGLGLTCMVLIQKQLYLLDTTADAGKRARAWSKFLAMSSLVIWASAIAAGRLLAYLKG
jgi:hypothetical protein